MVITQNETWHREVTRRMRDAVNEIRVAKGGTPENYHLKRIGKKRWGVFYGASQLILHEIRGSWPSAKEQFVVWEVTRRLGI